MTSIRHIVPCVVSTVVSKTTVFTTQGIICPVVKPLGQHGRVCLCKTKCSSNLSSTMAPMALFWGGSFRFFNFHVCLLFYGLIFLARLPQWPSWPLTSRPSFARYVCSSQCILESILCFRDYSMFCSTSGSCILGYAANGS